MLKTFLKSGLITAVLVGGAVSLPVYANSSLTVVSWGGSYSAAQKQAFHDPWSKKTGTKIYMEPKAAHGLAGLRSQEEAGKVTWDLIDMVQGDAIRACDEGLAEEINYDKDLAPAPDGTPASKDFLKGSTTGCFVPEDVYSTVIAYNDTAFSGKKPTSAADLFDLKDFPGKRALQKSPQGNLEWALLADGVPPSKVYHVLSTEKGVERAFKKLDTIKDHIVWWTAGAQPPQLLADKEVTMATGYNGRFFNAAVNEKEPFTVIWDDQMYSLEGWIVPKGKLTPDVKAYLRFMTDTKRLAALSDRISYGPARHSSIPLVGKNPKTGVEMRPYLPTAKANFAHAFKVNVVWWADHGDELKERFDAWLAK